MTFRGKDTPTLKPTGRYQRMSDGVSSVPAANQVSQTDIEEKNDDGVIRSEEYPEDEEEYEEEQEEIMENIDSAEAQRERLIRQMQVFKKNKYQAIINDDILFEEINFIDLEGKFHENVSLKKTLQRYVKDKTKYTLVLVSPKTATCRLFDTKEYNDHVKKAKLTAQQNKIVTKHMQISWNIGDNDLMYRMERAAKDLERGCRLDIILGARKAKLVRDREQREEMLRKIRSVFEPHAYEWRKMSGGFPNAELWFQGYSEKAKKLRADEAATIAAKRKALEGNSSTGIEGDDELDPMDDDDEGGSGKARNRRKVLQQADEEYRKLFPQRNQDLGRYWEDLAASAPSGKPASAPVDSPQRISNTSNVMSKAREIERI